jgi:hypothetical protein
MTWMSFSAPPRQAVAVQRRRVPRGDDPRLNSEAGKARYAMRRQIKEPILGQIKDVRGARRLLRRGLAACEAEWKPLCGTQICASCGATPAAKGHPRRSPSEPRGTATSFHASAGSSICSVRRTRLTDAAASRLDC